MTSGIGAQPDQFLPLGPLPYATPATNAAPGFAAYAATTQADYQTQQRDAILNGVGLGQLVGLCNLLSLTPFFTNLSSLGNPSTNGFTGGFIQGTQSFADSLCHLATGMTTAPGSTTPSTVLTGATNFATELTSNPLTAEIMSMAGTPAGNLGIDLVKGLQAFYAAMASITDPATTTATDIINWATSLGSAVGTAVGDIIVNTFLGLTGSGYSSTDIQRALESIPGQFLSGTLAPGLLSNLNVGSLSAILPELLTNPNFDTPASILGQTMWTWDGTQGPPGFATSVKAVADGTVKELFSNPINVNPGQILNISGNTKWSGFVGAANSIALTVAQYTPAGALLGAENYHTIGSVVSPGSSGGWTALSAAYTVPAGVSTIFVRPLVTAAATAGTVWFGAMSTKPTGTNLLAALIPGLDASKIITGAFNESQITNLISDLNARALLTDFTALMSNLGLGTATLPAITNRFANLSAGGLLNAVTGLIGTVPAGQIPNLDASKIVSGVLNLLQLPSLPPSQISAPTIAFDAVGPGASATSGATINETFTAAAGDYVLVIVDNIASARAVSSLTYGGAPMTALGSVNLNNVAANGALYAYGLPNAPGGAQTIALTLSTAIGGATINAVSYAGVVSVGAVTTGYGSGAAPSVPLNPGSSQIVVAMLGCAATYFTAASGPRVRYTGRNASNQAGLVIADSSDSVTLAATTNASAAYATMTIVLNGVAPLTEGAIPTLDANWPNMIDQSNVLGVLGPNQIGAAVQGLLDAAYQGFTGQAGSNKSIAHLNTAAANLLNIAQQATALAQTHSGVFANRATTKPGLLAIDPSADAVFNLSQMSGGTPTFVNLAAGTSVLGFISTPDAGTKQSVIWLGQTTTNIAGLWINLYSVNPATGALTFLSSSANLIGSVPNTMGWNYWNIPTGQQLTAAQGSVYAVEMVVTGTGTYQVAGMPGFWLPNHPSVFPKALAAARTISTTGATFDAGGFSVTGAPLSGATSKLTTAAFTVAVTDDFAVLVAVVNVTAGTPAWNASLGGQPMTLYEGLPYGTYTILVFTLFNPPTGSQTATLNQTAAGVTWYAILYAASYSAVGAVGPSTASTATGTGTSASLTYTQAATGDRTLVVFGGTMVTANGWASGSQTNRFNSAGTANAPSLCFGDVAGSASIAFLATCTTSQAWGLIVMNLKAGQPSPANIPAPTYSNNVPWLGLGGAAGASQMNGVLAPYTAPGPFTYTLPTWANHFDVIVCSDGAGAQAWQTFSPGLGGKAGQWNAVTLTRGVDFPSGTTTFTGTVGPGGAGGAYLGAGPTAGAGTSVTVPGYGTISAPGGAGTNSDYTGASPGPESFGSNPNPYAGGNTETVISANGNPPGGGGAGGATFWPSGGNGAPGAAYIYASQ